MWPTGEERKGTVGADWLSLVGLVCFQKFSVGALLCSPRSFGTVRGRTHGSSARSPSCWGKCSERPLVVCSRSHICLGRMWEDVMLAPCWGQAEGRAAPSPWAQAGAAVKPQQIPAPSKGRMPALQLTAGYKVTAGCRRGGRDQAPDSSHLLPMGPLVGTKGGCDVRSDG